MLLDRTNWDLTIDAAGNWARADEPYAQTQDAASAVRVVFAEAYYDTSLGVAYFNEVLGLYQPTQLLRARAQQAALTVPGVIAAKAVLTAGPTREMTGQIQITTSDGTAVLAI